MEYIINALYGKDCDKISLVEEKAEMHENFRLYGELVEPQMMQQFTSQLKWDVVGYMGYKEYAMHALLDCFEIIVNNNPYRWKDLGSQLYVQSKIADLYSNHAAYEIKHCIAKAATMCGIVNYCELRKWDDKYKLSLKSDLSFTF